MSETDSTTPTHDRKSDDRPRADFTGRTIGHWFVPGFGKKMARGRFQWECRCVCGTVALVPHWKLEYGGCESCGCLEECDLTEQTFGLLTVLESAGRNKTGTPQWLCRCSCGNTKVICGRVLIRRHNPPRSCGCYTDPRKKNRNNRLFRIYACMKSRCYDPNHEAFHRYSGRGIGVCDEWLESFPAFQDWALSHGYEDHPTLERKDGDLGYSPENCTRATMQQQQRNRRNNITVAAFGESKIAIEWAEDPRCQATYAVLCTRLKEGWDAGRAIVTPSLRRKNSPSFHS